MSVNTSTECTPVVENYRVDYLGASTNMDGQFSMNKTKMSKGYTNKRASFQPGQGLVYGHSVHHQNARF